MELTDEVLFREVQGLLPFHPAVGWVVVGLWCGIPLLVLGALLALRLLRGKRRPRRRKLPVILAAAFSGLMLLTAPLPVLMLLPSLTVEVRPAAISAQLWPFMLRADVIPMASVLAHEVRSYDPIGEFGGWGIRIGRTGRAYNARGDRGVQLVLSDGRRLLLGSQRPEELAAAIAEARRRLSSGPGAGWPASP